VWPVHGTPSDTQNLSTEGSERRTLPDLIAGPSSTPPIPTVRVCTAERARS
jgi:hypothetical protein